MKKVVILLIILFSINLIPAYSLSPSQQADVTVTVVNGSPPKNPNPDRGDPGHYSGIIEFCTRDWQCEGWGECNNFVTERKCIDLNKCRDPVTITDKGICFPPKEDVQEFLKEQEPVTKLPNWFILLISLVLILAAILIFLPILVNLIKKRK